MKKHLPGLIWTTAGILLCIFCLRLNQTHEVQTDQIILFYASLMVAVAGLMAHTFLHKSDNVCTVNFAYKLLGEALLILFLLGTMLSEIFFPA